MKVVINLFFLSALIIGIASCGGVKNTTTEASGNPTMSMESPGSITFAAANNRYNANGTFNSWRFTDVKMKSDNIETLSANLEIDLASISEKSDKLTSHLKSADYFNVAAFAKANITISNVQSNGGDAYTADMELSMMGKSQKLVTEFVATGKQPIRVKGTATVDRSIFGIGVDNTGVPSGIVVSFDTALPN